MICPSNWQGVRGVGAGAAAADSNFEDFFERFGSVFGRPSQDLRGGE